MTSPYPTGSTLFLDSVNRMSSFAHRAEELSTYTRAFHVSEGMHTSSVFLTFSSLSPYSPVQEPALEFHLELL